MSYTVDVTFLRSETVTAEADGTFELTVVPQPGEEGLWSVEAAAIKVCVGTTGFLVLAGPTPAPTVAPTAAPTAVPTPAPTTGTLPDVAVIPGPQSSVPPFVVGAALLAAAGVVALRRRSRRAS